MVIYCKGKVTRVLTDIFIVFLLEVLSKKKTENEQKDTCEFTATPTASIQTLSQPQLEHHGKHVTEQIIMNKSINKVIFLLHLLLQT